MESVVALADLANTRSICVVSPSASNVTSLPASLKVSTSAPSVDLAPELAGGEDDDLVALGGEVVRAGAEVLAHELPPQLAHGLLAVMGPRWSPLVTSRVVARMTRGHLPSEHVWRLPP